MARMSEDRVSEAKKKKISQAEELAGRISQSRSVAVVDLKTTPGSHISTLRKAFSGETSIVVRKKAVIERAVAKAAEKEPTLSGLEQYVAKAQPALILSSASPFKVQSTIAKAKVPARAKTGRVPDRDIVVPAGDTGLPPGPAIGDLQKINLPAKIQKGKIVVEKETVVTKAGEPVTKDVADALIRLGLEPFETQMNVLAAWNGGIIYTREILAVDEAQVFGNFMQAHSWAFNLAVEVAYTTQDTVEALVKKAALIAATVAIETKTVPGENVSAVLTGAAK